MQNLFTGDQQAALLGHGCTNKGEVCVLGSRAVDGKRFLEANASSIPGTYFRLG